MKWQSWKIIGNLYKNSGCQHLKKLCWNANKDRERKILFTVLNGFRFVFPWHSFYTFPSCFIHSNFSTINLFLYNKIKISSFTGGFISNIFEPNHVPPLPPGQIHFPLRNLQSTLMSLVPTLYSFVLNTSHGTPNKNLEFFPNILLSNLDLK